MNLFRPTVLSACAILSACGGGGGDGEVTSGEKRITQQALHGCLTEAMSPVDMDKLSCLVGRLDGSTSLSLTDQANAEPCSIVIDDAGGVTVTQGALRHTHTLSAGRGTYSPWNTLTSFSEYSGRGPAKEENGTGTVVSTTVEGLRFGTNTGSVNADGTTVPDADWKDLQLLYLGPSNGESNSTTVVTVGSANGINSGVPRITCYGRL